MPPALPSLSDLLYAAPFIAVALFAITFHEAAHAVTAAACGDDTAKSVGRASLNPFRHIDLFGTILLPLALYIFHSPFLFGWAKPVPVDWSKLRHWRSGMMLVAAAGPVANLTLAGLSFAALMALPPAMPGWLSGTLQASVALNLILGLFNLIPIPPLDGSKILAGVLPEAWALRFAGLGRRAGPGQAPVKWISNRWFERPKPPGDPGV
jgi:Zn-dependent protease